MKLILKINQKQIEIETPYTFVTYRNLQNIINSLQYSHNLQKENLKFVFVKIENEFYQLWEIKEKIQNKITKNNPIFSTIILKSLNFQGISTKTIETEKYKYQRKFVSQTYLNLEIPFKNFDEFFIKKDKEFSEFNEMILSKFSEYWENELIHSIDSTTLKFIENVK